MLAGMGNAGTLFAATECEQSAFPKGILQIFNKIKGSYTLECKKFNPECKYQKSRRRLMSCDHLWRSNPYGMLGQGQGVQIQPPPPVMEEVGCGEHPH